MSYTKQVKAWLQLTRAHTVVLEGPIAVLGAALSLGTLFDYRVGLWIVFGVMYHLIGYGMNSYVDWDKGFDKEDERKQHHPLNTGSIEPDKAKKVIGVSFVLLFVYLFALTYHDLIALGMSVLMVISGVAYNYFGKYTIMKSIPISIAHTLVFFIPYTLYSDSVGMFGLYVTLAYFVHHFYQIAISGDIKDLDQDEASLIQYLGAKVEDGPVSSVKRFSTSPTILIFAYGTSVVEIGLTFVGEYSITPDTASIFVTLVFAGLTFYDTDNMLQSGAFLRESRLKYISRREFFGYTMIHSLSIQILGIKQFGLIVLCMLIYLGLVSKFIWGNWLVPDV